MQQNNVTLYIDTVIASLTKRNVRLKIDRIDSLWSFKADCTDIKIDKQKGRQDDSFIPAKLVCERYNCNKNISGSSILKWYWYADDTVLILYASLLMEISKNLFGRIELFKYNILRKEIYQKIQIIPTGSKKY